MIMVAQMTLLCDRTIPNFAVPLHQRIREKYITNKKKGNDYEQREETTL